MRKRDIRQSSLYAKYMERIGWVVEEVDGVKIFIKKFPLIGSFIKIQRQGHALSVRQIDMLARKYRAGSISLEYPVHPRGVPQAGRQTSQPRLTVAQHHLGGANGFKVNKNPYLPTRTIRIDLTPNEEKVFGRFTEAKRRAVRKAMKNKVTVRESKNINEFIKLKTKDFWPFRFFMAKDVQDLWQSFQPINMSVLIAYKAHPRRAPQSQHHLGGVLLLFYDGIAYYWMAVSTNEGKKLFAPTLLVWEALKLAKKKGCKTFDFEGIYDKRFHNATKKWQGFTKFKEGFGGKEVVFPEPLIKRYFHITF